MALLRASEHFDIADGTFERLGVFNPVIGVDSPFYLDPLLLKEATTPEFAGALNTIRSYYADTITLIRSGGERGRRLAVKRLQLPEVRGIGIGCGAQSDDGSAVGPRLAERLIVSAEEILQLGIEDPAIFEVMGLFEDDFGPDRLSDSLINILEEDICRYTQRVSAELGIPTDWVINKFGTKYNVPTHPTGLKPLLFLPWELLNDMPVAMSFDDIYSVATFNDSLRDRFNKLIAPCFKGEESPTKAEIKEYILSQADRIASLLEVYESGLPKHYDNVGDPKGLHRWLEKSRELVLTNPLNLRVGETHADVIAAAREIISSFKNFVEVKGGWRCLYNDRMIPLDERHARLLFYATAITYVAGKNIDVSPESNAGRGPVDFKLSRGEDKVVVEIKLTKGHVKQGFEKQTVLYQETENASHSFFVVAQVTETSAALEKVLRRETENLKLPPDEQEALPEVIVVDAREKPSASKA